MTTGRQQRIGEAARQPRWQAFRGGVTSPRGFLAATAMAGLRTNPAPDLALLVVAGGPGSAAAVFTTNRFKAAPVIVAQRNLATSGGRVRAVVVNAGCANAGTGAAGIEDAVRVVEEVASAIGCPPEQVFPASTGLIGSRLPVPVMQRAVRRLRPSGSRAAGRRAARAIMTTDTRPKEAAVRVHLGDGRAVTVAGMAKGAGMIHPQLATMLAFVTTDAPVADELLQRLLGPVVDDTFNQVTVDGDASTNDCVLLVSSGALPGPPIGGGDDATALSDGLRAVCRSLARQIAADGEGARTLIQVVVAGARDTRDARTVARTVAGSNLVKAAVHGADPNWGRIAAAAGRSGAELDPDRLRVQVGPVVVYDGAPRPFDPERASAALSGRVAAIRLDLGLGDGSAEAWGCDLSAEYVAINSEYST
ncbi:MAG TPA: bifunctional glutamate N-acetyltransferase/amino-acid acetyltransferase ArgJ [Candidatus Binatia bacterium]|nr:bifunctional glutamate N-acetyltransferase/amino-acid acetyltransferase ArgJ [Candidatus Binatia bacterium]